MRPSSIACSMLAMSLVVPACSEPTVTNLTAPSFSLTNGPDNPGSSGVFRFGDRVIVRLDYLTDQGVLLVRHYPSDDSFEVCGGTQLAPILEEQSVTDPNLINGVIVVLRKTGEIPVLIYPPFDGSKPLCDYLRDDWLYRGTGRLMYQDNNFFFEPSRTNAFGWRGQGTVYDQSGQRYQYTEEQFFVVDPEPFAVHKIAEQLRITPAN